MTTFTLRASEALTGQLSSAEMRSWLEEFLRQPHPLPRDPGSGFGRVSLTLLDGPVNAVAAYSQCSVSSTLRRVAVERLGVPRLPVAPVSRVIVAGQPAPVSTATSGRSAWRRTPAPHGMARPQDGFSHDGEAIAGALIQFLIWVLVVGACFFFTSRKKEGAKGA
jgi:hypothetical protein